MSDTATLILAAFLLAAFAAALVAAHRGWHDWLHLKQAQLTRRSPVPGEERSDIAELRSRVKKLEAIAACVDL